MGLATCYAHLPNYDSTFKYLDAVLQENPNYAKAYQLKERETDLIGAFYKHERLVPLYQYGH